MYTYHQLRCHWTLFPKRLRFMCYLRPHSPPSLTSLINGTHQLSKHNQWVSSAANLAECQETSCSPIRTRLCWHISQMWQSTGRQCFQYQVLAGALNLNFCEAQESIVRCNGRKVYPAQIHSRKKSWAHGPEWEVTLALSWLPTLHWLEPAECWLIRISLPATPGL